MNAAPVKRLDEIMAESLAGPDDEPAITWQGETFDWGWVRRGAERVEAALASAGVPGDAPVGIIPRQRPDVAPAFLSMLAHRRSMTMIYSYQTPEAIAADVRKLRTAAVVAHDQDWTDALIEAARDIGAAGLSLSVDGGVALVAGLETVGPGEHRAPNPEPSIDLLTSGTSGPPKRYPIPFEQFRRCMLDSSFHAGSGPGDRRPLFVTVPIANISGVYFFIVAAAQRRAMILENKFSLDRWLEYQRTYRPLNIGGPTALVKMILDADVAPEDLSAAKYMVLGAGPVDPVLRRQFEARYGIPILPAYGATEFVGTAVSMSLENHQKYGEAKFGSVGLPVRGGQVRIKDQDTDEVVPWGSDQIGIVEVQLDGVGPDWIRTTDLGRMDADGFLYLHGRADGVINRGGFKIHPGAIESVLMQHPAVAAAAVVGVPDPRLGQVPVAAVELKPGAARPSTAEIDAYLRAGLPATNIPTDYRIVEALPRTPSFKIRLDAVRELFAAAQPSERSRTGA